MCDVFLFFLHSFGLGAVLMVQSTALFFYLLLISVRRNDTVKNIIPRQVKGYFLCWKMAFNVQKAW